MRKISLIASVCVVFGAAAAWAGPGSGSTSTPVWTTPTSPSVTVDPRAPFTPSNDLELIDSLGPHHETALQMATEELARGSDPETKSLAQTMIQQQAKDIEEMRNARRELTGSPNFRPMRDPHTDADIARMKTLTGSALDQEFLRNMIPHHGSGLSLVHRAMPHLTRSDIQRIARDNFKNQAQQIGEMERLREVQSG